MQDIIPIIDKYIDHKYFLFMVKGLIPGNSIIICAQNEEEANRTFKLVSPVEIPVSAKKIGIPDPKIIKKYQSNYERFIYGYVLCSHFT
jgi:hypothetical protein